MIHIYKPTPKVTGTACSFYLNKRDNSFFATMIKQDGWDSNRRAGSFKKNKDNPDKKVNIKFSPTEVASFIDAIRSNRKITGYHGSNQIVKFNFGPYERDGGQVGYSFGVTKESKEDSTSKTSFLIGFTFAEGELLAQHLSYLLQESFKITDDAIEKSFNKNSNFQQAPQASQANEAPSELSEEDEDDLW